MKIPADMEDVWPTTIPRLLVTIDETKQRVHLTHSWYAKSSGKVMHRTIELPLHEWRRAVTYAVRLPAHVDPEDGTFALRVGMPT